MTFYRTEQDTFILDKCWHLSFCVHLVKPNCNELLTRHIALPSQYLNQPSLESRFLSCLAPNVDQYRSFNRNWFCPIWFGRFRLVTTLLMTLVSWLGDLLVRNVLDDNQAGNKTRKCKSMPLLLGGRATDFCTKHWEFKSHWWVFFLFYLPLNVILKNATGGGRCCIAQR